MRFINAHCIEYTPDRFLSFDDVLLLPQMSNIPSRNDPSIKLTTRFTSRTSLSIPIISANMDSITESKMAITMGKLGGAGILHRFYKDYNKWLADVKLVNEALNRVAFSIGLAHQDLERIDDVLKISKQRPIVCIDVANAQTEMMYNHVLNIRKKYGGDIEIIAGNVCTPAAIASLASAGVDAVKVGVGPGSVCSTRVVTGVGCPQFSSIVLARNTVYSLQKNIGIIADGGIRNSGDIVKALAAGADSVMIGRLLAGTDQAAIPNLYRGQASQSFLEDRGKTDVSAEGESITVNPTGSAGKIIHQLVGGLKSGMTYTNSRSIPELYNNATFIEITNSARIEGTPHAV